MGARLLGGFQKFSRLIVRSTGHPLAFAVAIGTILVWAMTVPLFRSGNTWLLVINTVTNIVTFLMIFLIRSAQNRESEAVQLKLDELIRANVAGILQFGPIVETTEEDLDRIKTRFERLAKTAREKPVVSPAEVTTMDDQAAIPEHK